MFKDLFAKMSEVMMQAKDAAKTSNDNAAFNFNLLFKKIWNCAVFTIQYMTG